MDHFLITIILITERGSSPFNYTYVHDLTRLSNNFKIEVNEVIRIINYVFTTGEVYTSPAEAPIPFAMYYDFIKGWI